MKILRISLRNIASLAGTHTVDFTREPLRSAGLFSISGPTGAGKSSLLDALCLALYGNTPRLSSISITDLERLANGEKQKDPRTLLRRGTAEGFAEAAFTGVDGQEYTARWSVRRSRNKTEGQLQPFTMTLYRGNIAPGMEGTQEQGGKKTEVLPAITAKLGLTFDQFTRAVLLAQNDFAAFLKADDKTRAEILQALTGTERFEAISVAVFDRSRAEDASVQEMTNRLAGNVPLSPEDHAAIASEMSSAETALHSIESVMARHAEQVRWFQQHSALTQTVARAKAQLDAARAAKEAAAPRRAELARTLDAALHARPLRETEQRVLTEQQSAEKSGAALLISRQAAEIRLTEKQQTLTRAAEHSALSQLAREQAQPQLLAARQLDARLAPLVEQWQKAGAAAAIARKSLEETRGRHESALQAQSTKQAAMNHAHTRWQALAVFQPFARDAAAWFARLNQSAAARAAQEEATKEAVKLVRQEQQLAQQLAAGQAKEPPLRAAVESTRAALAAAEAAAAVEAAAVRLRESLHKGQPCPVCGAHEHPFQTHPPVADAALSGVGNLSPVECRKAHDAASAALKAEEKRIVELDKQLAVLRNDLKNAQANAAATKARHATALTELEPLVAGLSAAPEAPRHEDDAAGFHRWFEAGARDCTALEQRRQELTADLKELSAVLVPLAHALTAAEEAAREREVDAAAAGTVHEAVQIERAKVFAGRAADEVETELDAAAAAAERARKECQEAAIAADKELTAATEALKAADAATAAARLRATVATGAMDEWLAAFSARCGQSVDRAALDALLARDSAWREREQQSLTALEDALQSSEGALKANGEHLSKHETARPADVDEATVTAALAACQAERTAAQERLTAARAILLSDDQRRAENAALANELNARQAKAEPWQKLNELIGSADGAKFRGIAQRRTLDILLGYANAQLAHLAARYRLERLPESLNLIVRDGDMADERRSVHSLSGGESFLVSLALALGLASLTSNRLRIESLFIDEGFGSLDAETLNTAMGALMQLEAQGRKVGVISHVAEMADAIPVQIRVVKGRSGAARLEVPGMDV